LSHNFWRKRAARWHGNNFPSAQKSSVFGPKTERLTSHLPVEMILNLLRVLANRCPGSLHVLGVTSLEVVGVDVKELQAATSAGRIPESAILLGGTLGGVLVFAVALALLLSNRFPTPRANGWVIEPDSNASVPERKGVDSPRFAAVAPVETTPVAGKASPVEITSSAVAKTSVEAISSAMTKIPAAQTASLADPVVPVVKVSFADRWTSVMALPEAASSVQMPAQAARLETPGRRVATPQARIREKISVMEEVDEYLWEVYQRTAVKSDSSGDFTWKDLTAAKRAGMSLRDYVIGGMDADFREQLYHAGRAMDSSGINWSMLSAFRDDYRQSLASGFKAHGGNSLHGGSKATGGYGHGQALDITTADGDASAWHWIDAHGEKYGLRRPIPGPDPAHVQPGSKWHEIAVALRNARINHQETQASEQEPAEIALVSPSNRTAKLKRIKVRLSRHSLRSQSLREHAGPGHRLSSLRRA
jgi:hypothetical protein